MGASGGEGGIQQGEAVPQVGAPPRDKGQRTRTRMDAMGSTNRGTVLRKETRTT
jgi:hypothetical protein